MALGKAVVSWDYPGVRRLLDNGRAGILVQPGNLDLMAESITRVHTENGLRGELEKKAYETALNKLAWSKIGIEVLKAINNTLWQ
jgi:glycosyltransferase involved in cell wall biosynthesis